LSGLHPFTVLPSRGRVAAAGRDTVLLVAPILLLLGAWDLSSRAFGLPRLFPGPGATLSTLFTLTEDGTLLRNSLASLGRILSGWTLGGVLGVGLGLSMGVFSLARLLLSPYVDFLRFVSAMAWVPAFMLWFGLEETSKVALITYTATFAVAVAVAAGVAALPRDRERIAASFGASAFQRLRWVVLPGVVPAIGAGLRIAAQNAFMVIVFAEMLAANAGLGFLIASARTFLAPDRVFVALLALGALGYLTDRLLDFLMRPVLGRYHRHG
jgi:ABC-type nitrate/sulfonate/bicarbonate transport system permease component